MKYRLFLLLSFTALLSACDTPQVLEDTQYSFFIFRYTNELNKEWIITNPNLVNGVYNYPKRYRNEPYFGAERWSQNPEKYTYNICELATAEKLLYLHGNYHAYFPYTNINAYELDEVRIGKWEDICDINPLNLPIKGSANGLYKEIWHFDIRSLEKITGKSRKEMTIEDMEDAINEVIDKNELGKYSTKVYNMWQSVQ